MLWISSRTRNGFLVISKKSGTLLGALVLTLTALLSGCSEATEPQAIDDQEREQLTGLVEESSWVENATCTVQVFRQEGPITYGWAECTNELNTEPEAVVQSGSYPFRAEEGTVQVPNEGERYTDDVRRLFPADLISTIEQYSGMRSPSAPGN